MHEPENDNLGELAAAVADGRVLDWDSIESGARDEGERASIRRLRAIAVISEAHADLTFSATGESLSVRSLLPGIEDRSTPATWGALRILDRVGRGRFGDVYRAFDPTLDRVVALKLLRRHDPTVSEREVVEEGRLMARVDHPNVIRIHGAQRVEGRVGLWMEFVEGRTLAAELRERGPFPAEEVAQVGIELSRALNAVHEAGLVHRDVKAQNVLRERRGRILLGDFGTGSELGDELAPCEVVGTPNYIAPEVFDKRPATAQSDIYSLGVLLFHLSTGHYPLAARSLAEIRVAHAKHERTPLTSLRPDFPRSIVAIIERATSVSPSHRYRSAAAMEDALTSALKQLGMDHRGSRRMRFVAITIAAAMIAVAIWRFGPDVSDSSARPEAVVPTLNPPVDIDHGNANANAIRESFEDNASVPTQDDPASTTTHSDESRGELSVPSNLRPSGRAFRQIEGLDSNFGMLSPDGRLFSFTDPSGPLGLLDLASGQRRSLPETTNSDPQMFVVPGSFSRDSSRVTYVSVLSPMIRSRPASERPNVPTEIRSISVNGGPSKLVWRSPYPHRGIVLHHAAGDDDVVLVGSLSGEGHELMLISSPTGKVSASRTVALSAQTATLSPDHRHVAFDFVDPASGLRDIDVWNVESNTVTPLTRDPSSDRSPLWTSDGRHLLFLSSRSGTTALWAQPMERGRPVGVPLRLYPDLGEAALRGLTSDGTLALVRTIGGRDTYVADTDPATLKTTSEPRRVSRRAAATESAAWSPDGQQLAFVRVEDDRWTIVLKTMANGQEREFLQNGASTIGSLRWDPGGRSLLLRGVFDQKLGLRRLDLETGAVTTVLEGPVNLYDVLPTPGRIVGSRQTQAGSEIVLTDLDTRDATVLVGHERFIFGLAASRGGDRIAYVRAGDAGNMSIRVFDLADPARSREVWAPSPEDAGVHLLAWSPDDRELIISRGVTETGEPLDAATRKSTNVGWGRRARWTIWAVDTTTGSLRFLAPPIAGLTGARLSPNGRYLSIDTGLGVYQELWVLENALASLP